MGWPATRSSDPSPPRQERGPSAANIGEVGLRGRVTSPRRPPAGLVEESPRHLPPGQAFQGATDSPVRSGDQPGDDGSDLDSCAPIVAAPKPAKRGCWRQLLPWYSCEGAVRRSTLHRPRHDAVDAPGREPQRRDPERRRPVAARLGLGQPSADRESRSQYGRVEPRVHHATAPLQPVLRRPPPACRAALRSQPT